jgi:serine/threonine protein kinase
LIEYDPIRIYYKKLEKSIKIDKASICVRRSKTGYKDLINVKTNKKIFKIDTRLGIGSKSTTHSMNYESDEDVDDIHESVYGEVYKASIIGKKNNKVAIKVMPMTEEENKNRFDTFFDAWKELIINKNLMNKFVITLKWPHFSQYFGYFICTDGLLGDFSNKNILNQMKLRKVLIDLMNQYHSMLKTITDFQPNNRTTLEITNNLIGRIRSLGIELEQYEYTIRSPDPKFSLLMLIELENDTLSGNLSKYTQSDDPSEKEMYNVIRIVNQLHIAKKFKNQFFYDSIYEIFPKDKQYLIRRWDNIVSKDDEFYCIYFARYLDPVYVYSIIFQVLLSIEKLSNAGIAHLDMHVDNVLLDYSNIPFEIKFDKYTFWKYKIKNKVYLIPNYGVQVRIGDFGLSETIKSYKDRNKKEKKDFIMYILDRLSYFVFTNKEQRTIDELSGKIINKFVTMNTKEVMKYLKLYDTLIFLISLISELEYIGQNKYIRDLKNSNEWKYDMQSHKSLWIPNYINSLRLLQSNILNIFLDNLSGLKPSKWEYTNIVDDILNVFEIDQYNLSPYDSIINNKPYIV